MARLRLLQARRVGTSGRPSTIDDATVYAGDIGERVNRLVLGVVATGAAAAFTGGLVRIAAAIAVALVSVVWTCLWPTERYEVSEGRIVHRRAWGSGSVSLDELSRVGLEWSPYSDGRLVFVDVSGARVEVRISEETHAVRTRLGQLIIARYAPGQLRPMLTGETAKALGIDI